MVEREQSDEATPRGRQHLVLPSEVTWVKFASLSELQRGLGGGLNKIMFVKYLQCITYIGFLPFFLERRRGGRE